MGRFVLFTLVLLCACEGVDAPRYIPNGDSWPSDSFLVTDYPSINDTLSEGDDDVAFDSIYGVPDSGTVLGAPGKTEAGHDTGGTSTEDSAVLPGESDSESETWVETSPWDDTGTGDEVAGTEETTASVTDEIADTGSETVGTVLDTVDTSFDDSIDTYFESETEYVDSVSETVSEDTGVDSDTGTGIDTNPDTNWVTDPDTGPVPCPLNDAQFGGSSDTCWYLGDVGESCLDVCDKFEGEYSERTRDYFGSPFGCMSQELGGSIKCRDILPWFGVKLRHPGEELAVDANDLGCHYSTSYTIARWGCKLTKPETSHQWVRRLCACVVY